MDTPSVDTPTGETWREFKIEPAVAPIFPDQNPNTDAFAVFTGDLHIGNLMALMPPVMELPEGQVLVASKVQQWVWACWVNFWDIVKQYKWRSKKRLVVCLMGDTLHGTRLGKHPQVVNDQGLQIAMAEVILKPIRELADKLYVVKGTEFHSGLSGQFEELLSTSIKADAVAWRLRLNIGGKLFDLAHFGRAGTRPWTVGQANQLSGLLVDYATHHEGRMVDYMIRAHRHIPDDTGVKFIGIRGMITPSWMLADAYAHGRGFADTIAPIGGIMIDGNWVQHVMYEPKRDEVINA